MNFFSKIVLLSVLTASAYAEQNLCHIYPSFIKLQHDRIIEEQDSYKKKRRAQSLLSSMDFYFDDCYEALSDGSKKWHRDQYAAVWDIYNAAEKGAE